MSKKIECAVLFNFVSVSFTGFISLFIPVKLNTNTYSLLICILTFDSHLVVEIVRDGKLSYFS